MKTLRLDIHQDTVSVIEELRKIDDSEVEIEIPEGSVLFENSLNIKLIKKEANRFNKSISFKTNDYDGLNILDMIDENESAIGGPGSVTGDFISKEVPITDVIDSDLGKKKFSFPSLSDISLPSISLPKISFNFGILPIIIIILVLGGLGLGGYWYYWNVPKYNVEVIVESQPLISSVQIRSGDGLETSYEESTLKGKTFTSSVTKSKSTETTGSKIVGEKAKGEIKIINKTTNEKSFNDGEELYYEDDDDLKFKLSEDVTVPPAEPEDPTDPSSLLVPGSNTVSVEADDIGSDYNLDSGEVLEFDDYSKTDYIAEVSEDIDGGSKETLSIVTQEDLDLISSELLNEIKEEDSDNVKEQVSGEWVYINGSESSELTEEEFNYQVGDEADEVKVTQSVIFKGLGYNKEELEKMVQPALRHAIPDGFELSSKDTEIQVEILGNSNETILNSSQADLQVTFKSYIIPIVDEKEIKKDLAGKPFNNAKEILSSIPNIVNYSLNAEKPIPLFNRITKNTDNIFISLERD